MALISQREYARRRGIDHEAVRKRTVDQGGPIPTHGKAKKIDPDEADRLWIETISPAGASTSRFRLPSGELVGDLPASGPTTAATLGRIEALTQARTALLLTEAQIRRIRLDERRGNLLDRETTLAKFYAVVRAMRDAWLAWPARIGPELAADLGLDATRVMIALEPYVRRQLDELATVQLALDGRRRESA